MQKFIEVFHCLCLLKAIFKLLHFTVLSVIVSGVLFSRTFHRRYVFVRFLSLPCFPAHPTSFTFSAPFMNDISSLGFHWRYIFPRFQTVRYFPALAPQYGSYCCHALLKFFTGIVILFTVTRFQRQSKVTRWDVRQDCSFLFSFETSQVQTGTLGLSCWGCDSLFYSVIHVSLLICRWHCKRKE